MLMKVQTRECAGNPTIVQEAIKALSAFHVTSRSTVVDLLGMWSRRSLLTGADMARVLNHFAPTPSPVPFGADRFAWAGEVCTCGAPAVVVYQTRGYGDVGFCGRHG